MKSTALNNTRLIIALLAAGVIGGAGVSAFNAAHSPAAAAISPPAIVASSVAVTRMALPDFSRITERYGPSVVNISVTGTTKVSNDSPLAQGGIDGRSDPLCASSSASICATSFLTSGAISWAAIAGVAFGACNRGLCLVTCFDSLRLYPVCSPTNGIVLPCVIEKLRKLD